LPLVSESRIVPSLFNHEHIWSIRFDEKHDRFAR